jgi:hypothetical protein
MEISENSRIWIYQADRELTDPELQDIQIQLDEFTASWAAHGHALAAKGEIRYHRFLILSVDEEKAGVTGCSIDKSVALMKNFETQFGIQLFDRMQVAYWDGDRINTFRKGDLAKMMAEGAIREESIIFNNLIERYGELNTAWEIPLKDSWLNRLMPA